MHSIKHLLKIFSLFMFLIAALAVIYIGVVSNKNMQKKVAETNRTALTIAVNDIDKALERTDQQLYDLLYSSNILSKLSNDSDIEEQYLSQLQISNSLKQIFSQCELVNGLWYYIPDYEEFVVSTSGVLNMDESKKILESMAIKIRSYREGQPVESSKWLINEINGSYYLIRLIDLGKTYCGAWVRIDGIGQSLLDARGDLLLVFSSLDGNIVYDGKRFTHFTHSEDPYEFVSDSEGVKYLQVSLKSQTGEYWVSYLTQDNPMLSNQFDKDLFLVGLAAITTVILFFASVHVLQRIIYRPLIKLKDAMSDFRQGDFSPALDSSRLLEFELLNQTFESMIREIKDLKIDIYEQQLMQQKIKRQYLQIQLKSHFYLNCLNIIHSLAQIRNYKLIQELTRSLGAYFRYTSNDSSELNPLENELEHVRNYMHIQEIRFPDRFAYFEEVSPSLLRESIPSLVLQTFIENSVEHAIDLDKDNWIRLTITPVEVNQAKGMKISITDNGKGFTQQQLEQLNNKDDHNLVLDSKNEIGIKNVKSRLGLIYKEKAQIHFSNDPDGGAVINLWLPLLKEEDDK